MLLQTVTWITLLTAWERAVRTVDTKSFVCATIRLPRTIALDLSGLNVTEDDIGQLLRVEIDGWLDEIPLIETYYATYGNHVPVELLEELATLKQKLEDAKQAAA